MHIPGGILGMAAFIWLVLYLLDGPRRRERQSYLRRMNRGMQMLHPQVAKEDIRKYVDDVYRPPSGRWYRRLGS